MFRPTLTTAPATLPVTLAEVKRQMVVDFDDDDDLITDYITEAVSHFDGYAGILGRALINQVWTQTYSKWSRCLRLPFPDVSSVTITYSDTAGDDQVVSTDDYEILEDAKSAYVRFKDTFTSPSLEDDVAAPISIAITTGYGAAESSVPAGIRSAIKFTVAQWYQNRDGLVEGAKKGVPNGAEIMARKYKRTEF